MYNLVSHHTDGLESKRNPRTNLRTVSHHTDGLETRNFGRVDGALVSHHTDGLEKCKIKHYKNLNC